MQARKIITRPAPVTMAFTYSLSFSNLLSSTSQDGSLQFDSDADFELYKMSASMVSVTDTPATNLDILDGVRHNSLLCQLLENNTEQKLSNAPVPMNCLFGTGQEPFILSNPKVFGANTTLSVRMINQYTAQDFAVIRLSFIGRKIFIPGGV